MDDRVSNVADRLHEAAETHHTVYRITDGVDEDWASWYADWLIRLSKLPDVLGGPPVRSHLVTCWSSSTGTMRPPRPTSGGRTFMRESWWLDSAGDGRPSDERLDFD